MESIINYLKKAKIEENKISRVIKILTKNKINSLNIFLKIYNNQLKKFFQKKKYII